MYSVSWDTRKNDCQRKLQLAAALLQTLHLSLVKMPREHAMTERPGKRWERGRQRVRITVRGGLKEGKAARWRFDKPS